MARGDGGKTVFEDDKGRYGLMDLLGKSCGRFGWRVHAWVLMGNHPAFASSYGGQASTCRWRRRSRISWPA
jgi:hypothetical protein